MKTKFKLTIDLNSPSKSKKVKTPEMSRRIDYINSPVSLDSSNSVKHHISIIKVEKLTDEMLINCHK